MHLSDYRIFEQLMKAAFDFSGLTYVLPAQAEKGRGLCALAQPRLSLLEGSAALLYLPPHAFPFLSLGLRLVLSALL